MGAFTRVEVSRAFVFSLVPETAIVPGCLAPADERVNGMFVDAHATYAELLSVMGRLGGGLLYEQLYGMCIPTPALLDAVAAWGPVLEVGAGTGYLAFLLRRRGVDVVAIDTAPTGHGKRNRFFAAGAPRWGDVLIAGARSVRRFGRRTLLLAWPFGEPSSMASRALRACEADRLVYIGDDAECGDRAFHAMLANEWRLVRCVNLPSTMRGSHPARFFERGVSSP